MGLGSGFRIGFWRLIDVGYFLVVQSCWLIEIELLSLVLVSMLVYSWRYGTMGVSD